MTQDDNLSWLSTFPDLANLDEAAKAKLKQSARIVEAPVGAIGYREADPCNAYVMRVAAIIRLLPWWKRLSVT